MPQDPSERLEDYLKLPDEELRKPETLGGFLQALCDAISDANLDIHDIDEMKGQTAVKAVARLMEYMADESKDELRRIALLLAALLNEMTDAARAILDAEPKDFDDVSRQADELMNRVFEVLGRSDELKERLRTLYEAFRSR